MKRRSTLRWFVGLSLLLVLAVTAGTVLAAGPRVRVIHASPDAPAVDIWADGQPAFTNAPFTGITKYAELSAGPHQFQVVPAGKTEPAVISATLTLDADKDYSIAATGLLASIEPLVLEDNNAAPAAGKAHVRFVHLSPDAPAVDIAVKGGPVLFSNVAFRGVGAYLPVDAGTYDLEVRPAGGTDVVLSVPGVKLENGGVYTAWAMGLAGGEPKLSAALSVDRAPTAAPGTLPVTGGADPLTLVAIAGLGLIGLGLLSRSRMSPIRIRK